MAEVRLANLRIGFDYAADLNFPAGFLAPGESVRGKLRRFPGGPLIAAFLDERFADTVTWSLLAATTAAIKPGTYISEGIIYDGAGNQTPLADNVFLIDADYSPSE